MTPTELIAALEAAEGPSRELDGKIHQALGSVERGFNVHKVNGNFPHYTASIDAALSFTPEGWLLQLFQRADGWFCRLKLPTPYHLVAPFEDAFGTRVVATPAIALCIANLKALDHVDNQS